MNTLGVSAISLTSIKEDGLSVHISYSKNKKDFSCYVGIGKGEDYKFIEFNLVFDELYTLSEILDSFVKHFIQE